MMRRLLPILIVVVVSSCASTGRILVESDRAMFATISGADDTVNAACAAGLASVADCKAFNASLVVAWSAYEQFNQAAQEGSVAGIPAMLDALTQLRGAVERARPQVTAIIADLKRLYDTLFALIQKEANDAAAEG